MIRDHVSRFAFSRTTRVLTIADALAGLGSHRWWLALVMVCQERSSAQLQGKPSGKEEMVYMDGNTQAREILSIQ